MSNIEQRLDEIGIVAPEPFPPVGNYVSCARVGNVLYVGGHGPTDGTRDIFGKAAPISRSTRRARRRG